MADTITMTHKQLQRLLTRFKAEVEASGGECRTHKSKMWPDAFSRTWTERAT